MTPPGRTAASLMALGAMLCMAGEMSGQSGSRRGELVVEVRDAISDSVVVGAIVRVTVGAESSRPAHAVTNADGRATFQAPAGEVRVNVEALGYEHAGLMTEVGAAGPSRGGGVSVVVRLEPAPLTMPGLMARAYGRAEPGHVMLDRETQNLRGPDLDAWLRDLPGVGVRSRGSGGRSVVSLRGSRAQAVEVTLDGVPLTDPLTGVADLSLISAGTLERVVVDKGAGRTAGFGGSAGIIRLETRDATPGVRVGLSGGSHGRVRTDAEAGVVSGPVRAVGSVHYESGRNDFEYVNRVGVGTPIEKRLNADFGRWGALGRLSVGSARLLARVDRVERGVPGRMGSTLWDRARWDERLAQIGVSWDPPGDVSGSGPRAAISWSGRDQVYSDPRAGAADSLRTDQLVISGEERVLAGTVVGWRANWARVGGATLQASTERLTAGVRVSRAFEVDPSVTLEPTIGFDVADLATALSPALAAVWHTGETSNLRARAGQALRLPTFGDLFLSPGTGALPNPDLKAERVVLDAEVGWTWESGGSGTELGVSGFYRHTRDPIIWLPSVVAVWRPANAGRLTALGMEMRALVRPLGGWQASAAATVQKSDLAFDDYANPLPYHPHVTGHLAIERRGAGPDARLDLEIMGARRTNIFGPHELPAVALLDLRGRQEMRVFGAETVIEVGVSNVLNTAYERVELFPEPGRTFEIRLDILPGSAGSLQVNRSDRSFMPSPVDDGDVVRGAGAAGTPDRSSGAREKSP